MRLPRFLKNIQPNDNPDDIRVTCKRITRQENEYERTSLQEKYSMAYAYIFRGIFDAEQGNQCKRGFFTGTGFLYSVPSSL